MKASGDRGPKRTSDGNASAEAPAPGKTTLVQLLPAEHATPAPRASHAHRDPVALPSTPRDFLRTAFGPPVQAQGTLTQDRGVDVQAIASSGVAGSGGALPHMAVIQRSFGGEHDVSGVKSHVGGAAAASCDAIGASAYATGSDVAFRSAPDLHTAAHEAAHVVQQRHGVQLKGGVGAAGDAFERHADAVADRVVSGGSAEGLLDDVPGGGARGDGGQVQRLAGSGNGAGAEQLPDAPASIEKEEDFKPATGTKETPLKGTYGDFKVKHGLTKVPSKGDLGEYSVEIEMKPNKATGASKVGFMQTVRSANAPGSAWHTKGTDPGMTAERAKRTDPKTGWRVDRADPSTDKTPFYGMYKDDKGKINQYSTARVGTFGGDSARLEDAPSVADPRTREFVATAKDMTDGKEFGAVHWGFAFDSASKTSTEVTPALLDAGAAELKGRNAAVEKWNTVVATDGSGIDKVPGT